MKVKAKWALGVAVAVLLPVAASTYTLLNPARHWASIPVDVCVKSPGHVSINGGDTDGGVTATINALNSAWGAAVLSAAECSTPWSLGDGVPTIAFDEIIRGACSGSCLAATFTGYYDCDSSLPDGHCKILDADVLMRRNKVDKYGGPYYSLSESLCTPGREWNIESIMVHEAGHILGIGHSKVAGATMYPSISSCNSNGATIKADDRTALDALY